MSKMSAARVSIAVLMFMGFAGAAAADGKAPDPWSYNFTATTDYRFRGISQSDNDPAVQGSVEYDHPSGFFGNVWASSIDFSPFGDNDASVEVDLTAGYKYDFSKDTHGTLKVVYYWYPDSNPPPSVDTDYVEFIAGLSHKLDIVTLTGEVAYSPDYSGGAGDAWAFTGGASVPLTPKLWIFDNGIEASGHLGHQSFDVGTDYTFWDLGVSAYVDNYTVDVRYVDTDINACGDVCDAGLMLTASVGFGG